MSAAALVDRRKIRIDDCTIAASRYVRNLDLREQTPEHDKQVAQAAVYEYSTTATLTRLLPTTTKENIVSYLRIVRTQYRSTADNSKLDRLSRIATPM